MNENKQDKMVPSRYFQNLFQFLEIKPYIFEEAVDQVKKKEREIKHTLPLAFKEFFWYFDELCFDKKKFEAEYSYEYFDTFGEGKSSLANRFKAWSLWDLKIEHLCDAVSWHGWIEEWKEEFKRVEDKERVEGLIKQRVQFHWHLFNDNEDGFGVSTEFFTKNLDEDDPSIFIQVDHYPPEIVPYYSQFSKWIHCIIYLEVKLEFNLNFGVKPPFVDSDISKLEEIFTQHLSDQHFSTQHVNKSEDKTNHIFIQDQTILIIESYIDRNYATIKGKYKDQMNRILKKISEVGSNFPSGLSL